MAATATTTLVSLATLKAWLGITSATAKSVSSLTRSGSLATATVAGHGYLNGASVVLAGADQVAYNGTHTITVTGTDTFTFAVSGSPTSPATGTIAAAGPDTGEDTTLVRMADAACDFLEGAMNRVFVTRTVVETQDGNGTARLMLRRWPVVAVSSVTVKDDQESVARAITAYDADTRLGIVQLRSEIFPAVFQGVTVTYSAGYGPQDATVGIADIVQAFADLLKYLYDEWKTGATGASSVSIGSQTFSVKPDWPLSVKSLLKRRAVEL